MDRIKKSVLILLLSGFMVFLSMNSVDATLGNFVQGTCVEIRTVSNSSFVNISSLSFPNGTGALSNVGMDMSGKTFNFTFCDTDQLGDYIYDFFDAEGNVFVNNFLISPIGDAIDTGDSIIYIIILTMILIFFILFLLLAIHTPFDNIGEFTKGGDFAITKVTKTKYVKLIAIWITYGMFLWFVVIVTGLTNNYIQFEALKTLTTRLYLFFNTLGFGVSVAIIWLLFWNGWKDIILNKTIMREGKALLNSFT